MDVAATATSSPGAEAEGPRLLVFDVQRFCTHDGPGIRTVVFLKGCPLRCAWCQNPESQSPRPELAFHADRCTGCLTCAGVCRHGAIRLQGERVDRARCQACGDCAAACPNEALRLVGRSVRVEDLVAELLRDRPYHEATGGGITLSGGEPLLQSGVPDLLRACRRAGVSTAIETSGAVPWRSVAAVLPLVDLFLFDLKGFDGELHARLTGVPERNILANARRLAEAGGQVAFRMLVVPGLNDGEGSLRGVAGLLRELGVGTLHLLRHHRGGETKRGRLGLDPAPVLPGQGDADRALAQAGARLESLGIRTTVDEPGPEPRHPRAGRFSERVLELRRAVQRSRPRVCTERAVLVTDYFRRRRARPPSALEQQAEALVHVLRHRTVRIHPGELLVGGFSSHRVGGSVFPELHHVSLLTELLAPRRPRLGGLELGRRDRWTLALRVLPRWLGRFLAIRAFPLPAAIRFTVGQLRGRRYLVNESGGIAHLVPDYERLLQLGGEGIAAEARRLAVAAGHPGARELCRAVELAWEGVAAFAERHADEALRLSRGEPDPVRRAELTEIAAVCGRVPRHPARTFREALQSILFVQIALNLESLDNSISPGRLDQVLEPFLRRDLRAGRIDEAAARDLVGCFTVKLSEIVPVFPPAVGRFHGGLFNGQIVTVGGTDREGRDATNALTFMFLDAMAELRMRQPNFQARLHPASPPELVDRVASVLAGGANSPALVNDAVIVPMLTARGVDPGDARDYSPVGCVEPVAGAAAFGSTDAALANLALPLEWALGTKRDGARTGPAAACGSVEELARALEVQVRHLVDLLIRDLQAIERADARLHPTPLTSSLIRGCLEAGVCSTAGGARYNHSGVQGVGVIDVGNSLAAVEEVVFRARRCDLPTLLRALRDDFEGWGELRSRLCNAPKYGNDDPAADAWVARVVRMFGEALGRYRSTRGGPYLAGFYSVTAHVAFGETTLALPSGRRARQPLANGLAPAGGTERRGPTAALGSAAALEPGRWAQNGVNVNVRLDPASLAGARGRAALAGLVRGYFAQGGMQLQTNVLDARVLREARDDPSAHPDLLVRVSGYSAYFNDLSPAMKQEIIDRIAHLGAGSTCA